MTVREFVFGHSPDDWRQLAANIRRTREIFTTLADREEPMTTPRCENCIHLIRNAPDPNVCPAQCDHMRIVFSNGARLNAITCDQHQPVPQHSDDQWFALYGRFLSAANNRKTVGERLLDGGINMAFRNGDRSQSLWSLMQQAVNNA